MGKLTKATDELVKNTKSLLENAKLHLQARIWASNLAEKSYPQAKATYEKEVAIAKGKFDAVFEQTKEWEIKRGSIVKLNEQWVSLLEKNIADLEKEIKAYDPHKNLKDGSAPSLNKIKERQDKEKNAKAVIAKARQLIKDYESAVK